MNNKTSWIVIVLAIAALFIALWPDHAPACADLTCVLRDIIAVLLP